MKTSPTPSFAIAGSPALEPASPSLATRSVRRPLRTIAALVAAIALVATVGVLRAGQHATSSPTVAALVPPATPSIGDLRSVSSMIGADTAWSHGLDGSGVGVAMIDSGISAVPGTDTAVVQGPDFTTDAAHRRGPRRRRRARHAPRRHRRRADVVAAGFHGIAPGAHLVDLKVRSASGATDVASVVAAVDWATAHRAELGIGVINLAFNRSQPSPALTAALDRAWDAGLVVVVSAGNDGRTGSLTWPAADPRLLTVGATDPSGTVAPADDRLAAYSSRGDAVRQPDVVAPGRSIVSLVAPGAAGPREHPASRVGEHLVKGTGTSQSTAVVSGAVALLRQARPDLGPDAIKALLTGTAQPLVGTPAGSGAGRIDLTRALGSLADAPRPGRLDGRSGRPPPRPPRSTGWSSNAGRATRGPGNSRGRATRWSGNSWSGSSWSGNSWSGNSWSGNSWSGNSWSGNSLVGQLVVRATARGPGNSWSGNSWSGNSWSGNSWSGQQLVRQLVVREQLVRELVVGQQLELSDGGTSGRWPRCPPGSVRS